MKKTIGLLAATLALAQAADARTIGTRAARGDYATAIAQGEASRPSWLKVTITTSPRQAADGNYTVICTKGYGAGSKSGNIRGYGKFTRTLTMPMRGSDNCTISALGSLSGGGSIRVTLTAG